jgi:hypothetical protein
MAAGRTCLRVDFTVSALIRLSDRSLCLFDVSIAIGLPAQHTHLDQAGRSPNPSNDSDSGLTIHQYGFSLTDLRVDISTSRPHISASSWDTHLHRPFSFSSFCESDLPLFETRILSHRTCQQFMFKTVPCQQLMSKSAAQLCNCVCKPMNPWQCISA